MSVSAEQIERIVREVLASLPAPGGSSSIVPAAAAKAEKPTGQLSLSGKLITLAQLDKRLDGVQQVVVRRGAIVTPAAKDLLQERKIAVAFEAAKTNATSKAKWQLVCATAETKFDPAELLRTANKQGVSTERLANTGLVGVVDELADRIAKGGLLGLLFTTKTAAAGCIANRHRGVRAASANCHVGVRDAIAEIGVNLLLIDTRGKSTFQLGRMIQTFHSTADRNCPVEFAAKLK